VARSAPEKPDQEHLPYDEQALWLPSLQCAHLLPCPLSFSHAHAIASLPGSQECTALSLVPSRDGGLSRLIFKVTHGASARQRDSKRAYCAWLASPVSDRDWADAHLINTAFDVHLLQGTWRSRTSKSNMVGSSFRPRVDG